MTDKGHLAHNGPPAEVSTCRTHPRGKERMERRAEGIKKMTQKSTTESRRRGFRFALEPLCQFNQEGCRILFIYDVFNISFDEAVNISFR